jgi:predicted AlkP superfamily phosphohydrolase/phosphomutase
MGSGARRVCVVGLDGVPYGLLKRLAEGGVMPHVAAFARGGHLAPMRAALPPISSVSWTSFMTGANPGEHGIFGFTDVDPNSYALRFPLFGEVAVPTFWDTLGQRGLHSVVLNQPSTYPARPLAGVLVSGFVAIDLARAVYPLAQLPALQAMGYRVDADLRQAAEHPDRLLDDLFALLAVRRQAALHCWEQERWDYFQLVLTGTDRLHHFLWRAVVSEDDPRHARAMEYYRAVDEVIGELWDRFYAGRGAETEGEGFLLLSDHGFTEVRREVRLNAWLRERGYLTYRTESPETVADLAPGTRAFALDPGRIYVNVRDRFPQGCVAPEEAPALRAELQAELSALQEAGEPVIAAVFPREQIFHGARVHLAPDLVALGHPGFDLKGTAREREVFGGTHFQGMHTWEDAFVLSREPFPQAVEIADLAARITGYLLPEASG